MAEERPAHRTPGPFEEILEQYGSLLRGVIARVCPKALGLQFDDIEQEACLRLWRALQDETEIQRPASYLYRIAVTATLDAVRRATARREEQLCPSATEPDASPSGLPAAAGAGTSPETRAHERALLAKVRAILGRMAPRKRCAVGLHIRGFTPAEIGRLTGWTEARSRSLVYRGLKELRGKLAAEGIEYEG